ncbi:MAG TPA: hypothetical protein VGE97_07520 [Nitrososphaera sp.]|jgi:hypothetical protein
MSRTKLPLRTTFRQIAPAPDHDPFDFYLIGIIEDEKRHVITGLTEEAAKYLYDKLGEALNGNKE